MELLLYQYFAKFHPWFENHRLHLLHVKVYIFQTMALLIKYLTHGQGEEHFLKFSQLSLHQRILHTTSFFLINSHD